MNKKGLSGWLVGGIIFLIAVMFIGIFGFEFISGASFITAKGLAIIFVILLLISIIANTIKSA